MGTSHWGDHSGNLGRVSGSGLVTHLPLLLDFDFLHVKHLDLHVLDHPVWSQSPLLTPLVFCAHFLALPVLYAHLLAPLVCHGHLHMRIDVGSDIFPQISLFNLQLFLLCPQV